MTTDKNSNHGNKESTLATPGIHVRQKDISNFIDTHIRVIKYSLYGIGALSFAYILRRIYATKIITSVSSVPQEFITEGIKLQGHVKAVGSGGILYIRHIPLINLRRWSRNSPEKAVPMSVAMVDMTPYGSKWLQDNVHQQHVWFRILAVDNRKSSTQNNGTFHNQSLADEKSVNSQKSTNSVHAVSQKSTDIIAPNQTITDIKADPGSGKSVDEVKTIDKPISSNSAEAEMLISAEIFLKKRWRISDVSVNKELIALGLCKVDIPHESVRLSTHQDRLLQQLVRTQKEAAKKSKGLWRSKDSEKDQSGVKKVMSGVFRYSTKVITLPFRLL